MNDIHYTECFDTMVMSLAANDTDHYNPPCQRSTRTSQLINEKSPTHASIGEEKRERESVLLLSRPDKCTHSESLMSRTHSN